MAKPSGFSGRFGTGFGVGSYRYELVPWTWTAGTTFSYWSHPFPSVGWIDLRPLPAQALAGGSPQGHAFVASMQARGGIDLATSLHMNDADVTVAMQDAWQTTLGYRPQGAKLVDLLWDQLTTGADPTGDAGPKPIMPTVDGLLELHVPNHSLVKSERFVWGIHPHTNRVRDVYRRDFRRQWEHDQDNARRILDFLSVQHRIDDWRDLVPADLRQHVPGRLPHQTTITDNFNRADSDPLGSSSEGWSWTEVADDLDIVSNAVRGQGTNTAGIGRAESSLSSDNHYTQCRVIVVGDGVGPISRFDSSATTFYVMVNDGSTRVFKCVTGSFTNLGGTFTAFTGNSIAKLTVNGSGLEAFDDGVSLGTVTDSSITGNVRTGIIANNSTDQLDDFEAADLAATTGTDLLRSNLIRSRLLRGLAR